MILYLQSVLKRLTPEHYQQGPQDQNLKTSIITL